MHKIQCKFSVLVILLATLLDKTLANNVICGACDEYLDPCYIKSETGFMADREGDRSYIAGFSRLKKWNERRNALSDCVPAQFQVTGTLRGLVCFWSPGMGCKAVLGSEIVKSNFTPIDCTDCLMYCPCSRNDASRSLKSEVASVFAAIVFRVCSIIIDL